MTEVSIQLTAALENASGINTSGQVKVDGVLATTNAATLTLPALPKTDDEVTDCCTLSAVTNGDATSPIQLQELRRREKIVLRGIRDYLGHSSLRSYPLETRERLEKPQPVLAARAYDA